MLVRLSPGAGRYRLLTPLLRPSRGRGHGESRRPAPERAARLRNPRQRGASGRSRRWAALLPALGLVLISLGGCLPRSIGPRTITIEMTPDFAYQPREVVVRPGETVRFVVINRDDRLPHEVRSNQRLGPDLRLEPGQTHEFRWTAPPEPKAIVFWCGMPGHRKNGMAGRVVVRQ